MVTDKQKVAIGNCINALKAMISVVECLPKHPVDSQEKIRARLVEKCKEDLRVAEVELKSFKE